MNKSPVCFIFGAGKAPRMPPVITPHDFVIAADGGYRYTQRNNIKVDVLVGDFDSLDGESAGIDKQTEIIRLPVIKNETDLLAALKLGLSRDFKTFHICGCTGKRLDHTIAALQCLTYLVENEARGYMFDTGTVITAFRGEIRLAARRKGILSIFAMGESARGVYLQGARYELNNETISADFPIGISNEFIGEPVHIKVTDGILLAIYPISTKEINTDEII